MFIGAFAIGFGLGLLMGLVVGLIVGARRRAEIVAAVGAILAPAVLEVDGPRCAVCALPANPVRFHDGRYLCAAHK